jgi:DNA-binding MarR family transcriptional regulator
MNSHAHPTFPREAQRLFNQHQIDPSYWPDVASDIDTPEEELADELGTTPAIVHQMLDWLRAQKRDATTRTEADMLAKAFSIAIPKKQEGKKSKIDLSLVGMRFLALYWLLNSSGESLTDLAKRATVSKQLLDWHANKLGRELNFYGYQQKAKSTRTTYSESARQQWASLTPEQRRQRRAGKGKEPVTKIPPNKNALIRLKMLQLQKQTNANA